MMSIFHLETSISLIINAPVIICNFLRYLFILKIKYFAHKLNFNLIKPTQRLFFLFKWIHGSQETIDSITVGFWRRFLPASGPASCFPWKGLGRNFYKTMNFGSREISFGKASG